MPPGTRDQHAALPAASRGYRPIIARSKTIHAPIAPVAYDCVKLIFVRHGSAILLSEFGEKPVAVGDVVALAANTVCGSEPEGSITVTTRTPVTMLVADLDVRIIHAATGELLRELTVDPTRDYQPTGKPPGPTPKNKNGRTPTTRVQPFPMS